MGQTVVWWRAVAMVSVLATEAVYARQAAVPALTGSFDAQWITADTAIELRLNSGSAQTRVAVMLGLEDWTALFERTTAGLRYRPSVVPLPSGERPVVVYAVTGDGWREIGRLTLRVLTRGGFEKVETKPTVELANKGQFAIGRLPVVPPAPRDTFQDLTASLGIATTALRGGWTTTAQANVLGVSNLPEALRYAERQKAAPRFDVASYQVSLDSGRAKIAVGHLSYGVHRHLFNGFSSRGLSASFRVGTRADISLAAVNGSAVVGWSNPLGIANADHRIHGLTAGFELTTRPGGFRLEGAALDAKLLPRTAVNQGGIVDAERSRGASARLVASDARQRFKLEGGLTRSRFDNPNDPLLANGPQIVQVRDDVRMARFLDVSYAAVQSPRFSLNTAFNHEMVEPLFGSLQGFVPADVFRNVAQVNGAVRTISFQGSTSWSHDNLDAIPSILKTLTRVHQLNVAAPLSAVVGRTGARHLPSVTYALTRTHQFGHGVPANSDFQPTHVPDQISTVQSIGVDWQEARWRAGYRLNRSLQDNRQIGRERADLGTLVNNVTAGLAPSPRADIGIDLGFEGAKAHETSRLDLTRRIGLSTTLRPVTGMTIAALMSRTTLRNTIDATRLHNTDISLQFGQAITRSRATTGKPSVQFFARYARVSSRVLAVGANQFQRTWTLNTGVTFSIF